MDGKFEVEPVVMTLLFALIEATDDTMPFDPDEEPERAMGWWEMRDAITHALEQGIRHVRKV